VEEQYIEMEAAQNAPTYGRIAVEKAQGQGELEESDLAYTTAVDHKETLKVVGSRTFVLLDGTWVDTAFDPDEMETVKVSFLSDDYFALANARPNLAAAFALGFEVIALSEGIAYEVVGENETVSRINIPEPILPDPGFEALSGDDSPSVEEEIENPTRDDEDYLEDENAPDQTPLSSLAGSSTPVKLWLEPTSTESAKTEDNIHHDPFFSEQEVRFIAGITLLLLSGGLIWFWFRVKK
jgi:hypothetical protein